MANSGKKHEDGVTKVALRKARWKARLLKELGHREDGRRLTITEAARLAGITRKTVHVEMNNDPEFGEAVRAIQEETGDVLEEAAWDRAVTGIDEPVIYQGQLSGVWRLPDGTIVAPNTPNAVLTPLTIKRYSDQLLGLMLKANHPRYRDITRHEHSGVDGEPAVMIVKTAKVDPEKL